MARKFKIGDLVQIAETSSRPFGMPESVVCEVVVVEYENDSITVRIQSEDKNWGWRGTDDARYWHVDPCHLRIVITDPVDLIMHEMGYNHE